MQFMPINEEKLFAGIPCKIKACSFLALFFKLKNQQVKSQQCFWKIIRVGNCNLSSAPCCKVNFYEYRNSYPALVREGIVVSFRAGITSDLVGVV